MSDSTEVQVSSHPVPVFKFGEHRVRISMRDGNPWFSASDVCAALAIKNHRESVRHLDGDEKGVISNDTLGGKQSVTVVSESGLYALILRSRKPEAKAFTKWVTSEVLPSIRKTGTYQKSANPAAGYDRISPAQAQDLKEIVQAIVNAGIQSYGETWKRLQNKFKVNSYLQLPATSHLEARQYLVAKLPNGHHPEVLDEAPTINLTDADRLDSAMTLAIEAGAQAQRSVFNAVMAGNSDWKHGRYMLRFDTAVSNTTVARVNAIEREACVLPMERFHEAIEESFTVDAQTLARLASTCAVKLGRMAQRLNGPGPSMST